MVMRMPALCTAAVLLLGMVSSWAGNPVPDGLWRFDDAGNLTGASKGADLDAVGTLTAVAGQDASDGAVSLDAQAALRCFPGSAASGGGSNVNAYTFVFDVKVSQLGAVQPLLACAQDATKPANLSIAADGSLAFAGVSVTSPGGVATGSWVRVVFTVDMNSLNGALVAYLDGGRVALQQPAWWETIIGGGSITGDGDFSLPSSAQTGAYCTLLATQSATATSLDCSTIAYYGRALAKEEAAALATPRKPVLIETVPGATFVSSLSELLQLSASRYETVFMFNQTLADGGVRFENLLIEPAGTVVSWDEAYINVIGQVVSVNDLEPATGGYTAKCTWRMPGILGGIGEEMEVFLPDTGGIQPIGFHAEIPNFTLSGTEVKNAYVDFYPESGTFGGGGLLKTPTMGQAIGGSMELQFGIGPEILGYRMPDLTEFGVQAAGLEIPVGEVLELYSVGAKISNPYGLSKPANLITSALAGDFKLIVPPKIPIGGRSIFPFDIETTMSLNLSDGSFAAKGTGTILNTLDVAEMDFSYDPPFKVQFDGNFDMVIYTGGFKLSRSPNLFAGSLEGLSLIHI